MEQSPKKTGGVRRSRELKTLVKAAGQLCQVLSRIASDETQFYQREKTSRTTQQENSDPELPRQMDIKALKDMVESLKSLTKVVRDLQELPDQPERHSQELARSKLALAQEQVKQDIGANCIALGKGAEDYAN